MTKKEKLKILYELEQRVANLRAHIFYGYAMTGQDENIYQIRMLVNQIGELILIEQVKPNNQT